MSKKEIDIVADLVLIMYSMITEVTGKAIEETASVILRLYHDRKNRCSMPRISKLY